MNQQITPLAPPTSQFQPMNPDLVDKPDWLVGQAVTSIVSPDHKTLLVLTSGFNRVCNTNSPVYYGPDSGEYVFVYDISAPTPVKTQVMTISNAFAGIAFDPSGTAFYVPGDVVQASGLGDMVHVFTSSAGVWGEESPGLDLGHTAGLGLQVPSTGVGLLKPFPAGVAISSDGQTLVVANHENDSITVFTGGLGNWSAGAELDLRPGKSLTSPQPGVAGGGYPFWVVVKGTGAGTTAYVSSLRDREVDVVTLNGAAAVSARIPVKGRPSKMTLNAAESFLYVVEDLSDTVDVIDTASNSIVETISVIGPKSAVPSSLAKYTGANPTSATLSPDEKQLYVTEGNLNAVAVVALGGTNVGDHVVGLIPTGWYPNSASFSGDGSTVYVVNGKSPTGANPDFCYSAGTTAATPTRKNCFGSNEYNPQRIKAGFQTFARPTAKQLETLTAQVATNDRLSATESAADAAVMAAVRQGVKHVIFMIKENRTYDQVLGDLEVGNGDPSLTEFGEALTPNQHNLARTFVTLDSFLANAEVSYDGWSWTTSGRATEILERQFPVTYALRGLALDIGGLNRNINVALPTLAARRAANPLIPDDPDLLPGQSVMGAPDGPDHEPGAGFLWDAALRANLTVRNYGFFIDDTAYASPTAEVASPPLLHDPASTATTVAVPASASLAPYTDPYFRGFDNAFPDYYRYTEWAREFDANYAAGGLPSLSLVRFMHDHTGDFSKAIDGVNTPELQQADNDYAVGLLVQKIAGSIYASDTLIFVVEDDSQDGADHIDSHRTIAFVAGAYVKRGAVVSTAYNTVDFLRTIEEVLGLAPMNLNDALARPMADIFDTTPSAWTFTATAPAMLYSPNTTLPLPASAKLIVPRPTHDARYWARVTKGMDFRSEDTFDFATYNRVLWKGLMVGRPYPGAPTGIDLRLNRDQLLTQHSRAVARGGPRESGGHRRPSAAGAVTPGRWKVPDGAGRRSRARGEG